MKRKAYGLKPALHTFSPKAALQTFAIGLFLFAFAAAQAADLSIRAQVSEQQVSVGQQFVYSADVTATGDQATQLPEPQLPDFGELTVVQDLGLSQSSSFSMIGRSQSETKMLARRVILVANKEGTFTIPPARMVINGQPLESESIPITVTKPQALNLPGSLQNANILPAQSNSSDITRQLYGRLFMLGSVDKKEVYAGEPVRVTYSVLTDIEPQRNLVDNWLQPQTAGLPTGDYDSLPVFNLAVPRTQPRPQPTAELKQIEGKTFRAIKVFEAWCVPRRAGALKIGPYQMLAEIPVKRSDDPFGFPSFFDDNSETVLLPTVPLELTVKPLPARPDAASDKLLVGAFQAKAELDRQKMTQDELVTLRLTIQGEGNVFSIPEVDAKQLGDFEIFESSKKDLMPASGEKGPRGGRVYEYVLRARESGALQIPAMAFTSFDPASGQYRQVASEAVAIQVDPPSGAPEVFAATSGPVRSEPGVRQVGQGLAYIETSGFRGLKARTKPYEDPLMWALQAIPLMLIAGAFGIRRRRDWMLENREGVRKKGARAAASRRLRRAHAQFKANASEAFYAELSAALRNFFGDKLGRSAAGLRWDEVHEELLSKGVETGVAEEAARVLEQAESARFAPAASTRDSMHDILERAESLIAQLDRKV